MTTALCITIAFLPVPFTVYSNRASEDKITNLPGLSFDTNYDQYSGYLDLSNGHHLHYWLTESQSDPDMDPLVLWLNGGPGCSSLDGLLYELGPFHVYDNGTLWDNSNMSWNQNANIIFLESPICVGYSYQDDHGSCLMSDNTTADDNYHAMLQFLDKFPVYKDSDFYITGESYGGVYVPSLALRTMQGNANADGESNPIINLKAFAVGNGVTQSKELSNSIHWYRYHHGMISEQGWSAMQAACCTDNWDRKHCNFYTGNATCSAAVSAAEKDCCEDINPYDLYGECFHSDADGMITNLNALDEAGKLYSWDKFITEMKHNNLEDSVFNVGAPPCVDSKGASQYLNREDVKSAIHIPPSVNVTWSICSHHLRYSQQWSWNMGPIYDEIFSLDKDIYMTMYNGDTDTVCNFLGDEWFLEDRNLSVANDWREWFVSDENGKQVGGWTIDYQRFRFVTVRGAGHMVPQFRPQAALKLFQYFLQDKDLD